MAEIDKLINEPLKGLRSDVQTTRTEMHLEFRDVKQRLASVESSSVAAKHESADIHGDGAPTGEY